MHQWISSSVLPLKIAKSLCSQPYPLDLRLRLWKLIQLDALRDILRRRGLLRRILKRYDRNRFSGSNNEKLDAVIRRIEIIGEANRPIGLK